MAALLSTFDSVLCDGNAAPAACAFNEFLLLLAAALLQIAFRAFRSISGTGNSARTNRTFTVLLHSSASVFAATILLSAQTKIFWFALLVKSSNISHSLWSLKSKNKTTDAVHHLTNVLSTLFWWAVFASTVSRESSNVATIFLLAQILRGFTVSVEKSLNLKFHRNLKSVTTFVDLLDAASTAAFIVSFSSNPGISRWVYQLGCVVSVVSALKYLQRFLSSISPVIRGGQAAFLLGFHFFALVGFYRLCHHSNRTRLLVETLILYWLSGLGVTCGAHRLWAHRSYEAHWIFRAFLMILNSIANQGSILHWCRDHRVHHKYTEEEQDPHNASRGFFYSHMGWLLVKRPAAVIEAIKAVDAKDLLDDPLVSLQHRLDPYWNQTWSFVLPALYGYIVWGDYWLGFFVHGCLRWVVSLHSTWTVNSVAHLWGDRPYNPKIGPAESLVTSIVANGEGWHNWHHVFAFDYATAEGGLLTHWNPSKFVIDVAAFFGLVWHRKRALHLWKQMKERRMMEEKDNAEKLAELIREKRNFPTLSSITESITQALHKKSLFQSTYYIFKDLLICLSMACLAIYSRKFANNISSNNVWFVNDIAAVACWAVYAIAQGTLAFGFWVIGYDAAGGRFSNNRMLNHFIGSLLHLSLLIPYKPRRAHRKNERYRASLTRCLSDDAFAILKMKCPDWFTLSGAILALFVGCYLLVARGCGWQALAYLYISPWIVLNCWLMAYAWLMENGPQDCAEFEFSESTLQIFAREWLIGIWPRATRERSHLWTRLVDYLHHHLSLQHVVQAVDFGVPHYNVKEAFCRLGEVIGDVSSEVSFAKKHLIPENPDITLLVHRFLNPLSQNQKLKP